MAANPSSSLGLLDVLEQLPRDVLREDLWLNLSESSELATPEPDAQVGRAFRLVSQRSLHLSDQLTRRLKLLFDEASDGYDENSAVKSHGNFLARQVSLEQLFLADNSDTNGDSLIIKTLLLGGDTVGQRLQVLRIDISGTCTTAAGRCVQMCCPNLQKVSVHAQELDGSFFSHLRLFEALTQVTICTTRDESEANGCGEAIRSLAALPSLHTLTVEGILFPEHIPLLGHLTGLEELNARHLTIDAAPEDGPRLGQALACLTRLTQLALPDCGSPTVSGGMLNAAMAQMEALPRLSALSLDSSDLGPVLSDGFVALCQMSMLTRLACPAARDQPVVAAGGHLPLLQHLRIRSDTTREDLTATLRPLLPLPQLRHFLCKISVASDLGDDGNDNADGQAMASAWQAATLLAEAPQLQTVGLLIIAQTSGEAVLLGPATALLTPLRDLLTELRLVCLLAGSLDVLLPLLCLAGRLQVLSLQRCSVADSWLPLAVRHLPSLRRLQVDDCDGVTAASAVALAALRVPPLHLAWRPALAPEEVQQFHADARAGVTVGSDWVLWDAGDF